MKYFKLTLAGQFLSYQPDVAEYGGEINNSGIKVKVLGENSSDFKFKIKNKK